MYATSCYTCVALQDKHFCPDRLQDIHYCVMHYPVGIKREDVEVSCFWLVNTPYCITSGAKLPRYKAITQAAQCFVPVSFNFAYLPLPRFPLFRPAVCLCNILLACDNRPQIAVSFHLLLTGQTFSKDTSLPRPPSCVLPFWTFSPVPDKATASSRGVLLLPVSVTPCTP